jgi:hypothetical protein
MKPYHLILAVAVFLAPKVHGQSVSTGGKPVQSCSVADSLFGTQFTRSVGSVLASPSTHAFQAFSTSPTTIIPAGARGVVDFDASLLFPDTAVRDIPPVQFNLKTVSASRLTIEQRQLTLTIDDSLALDLGSMTAYEQNYPGSRDVHENLSIMAPVHRLTQVARARKVIGRLGSSEFAISETALRNIRALLVAGLCYSSRAE